MPIYGLADARPQFPAEGAYWVAPSADIMGKVRLMEQASVWFHAVLRGDNEWITVGTGSNIQDGCVCHTDLGAPLTIGQHCTIGHSVVLHGCTIGDESLIGMGTVVLNHAVIGSNCLIGANALITEGKVIPDNSLVVGSPGKVIRVLTELEIAGLRRSATNYIANWKRFAAGLMAV
jgi:carbonic anhydrase/acetyltransferase-like protein (isoleucine patch superfamily)